MSTFSSTPCRHSHRSSREENAIREIFFKHWENLKQQMDNDIATIQEWRRQNIEQIKSYSDEQIRILKQDYNNIRLVFDHQREENLEQAKNYLSTKRNNLLEDLLEACRTLKFQAARLNYIINEKTHPQVISINKQNANKQNLNGATSYEQNTQIKTFTENNIHTTDNNVYDLDRSHQTPTGSISNGTHADSGNSASSVVNNHNAFKNTDWKDETTSNMDDSIRTCPICYMIFPLHMASYDRDQHVSEHIGDDHYTAV